MARPTCARPIPNGLELALLKEQGATAQELANASYPPAELREAGFSARDLKLVGFSAGQLKEGGFSAEGAAVVNVYVNVVPEREQDMPAKFACVPFTDVTEYA